MENLIVRYDGSHYIGYKKTTIDNQSSNSTTYLNRNLDDFCKENMYVEDLSFQIKEFIIDNFMDFFTDEEEIDLYIIEYFQRNHRNMLARRRRFVNKGLNNKWNYFVTFTYDDKKHSEQSFRDGLLQYLQYLSDKKNIKYMGLFELSSTARLHFHGMMYIPKDKDSDYIETDGFNFATRKMRKTKQNKAFLKKFGVNSFDKIRQDDPDFLFQLKYIVKYISKNNDRIIYSRGLKDFKRVLVELADYAIAMFQMNQSTLGFVLDIKILDVLNAFKNP